MKAKLGILSTLLLTSILAPAQTTAFTNPVGYVSITCPANSDTIVGLPLRQTAAAAGTLSANPDTTTIGGSAILTLSGSPGFTTDQFATAYYVKLKSGAGNGLWFQITGNTANTITVNLNGGSIAAASGDSLEVLKFWTLNELFPPAQCTTNPLTTGNAIVASTSTSAGGRLTQILIPNLLATGINIAPTDTYFVNASMWRKVGNVTADAGNTFFWPDVYFVIRNPSAVTSATTYTISGEVEMGSFTLALRTLNGGQQDNFVAIPRGVNLTLNQLALGGNEASFMSSTGTSAGARRDQLLVYNPALVGQNVAPSLTYYYFGYWRKVGSEFGPTYDHGGDVIPAGAGFVIRKYNSDGATDNWNNTSSY
jgi:uncharacterized protein (TIGR02597 family)